MIPLSVIEMVRASKDNKFQVVTSHRIFVFRAENEGKPKPGLGLLVPRDPSLPLSHSFPRAALSPQRPC